MLPRHKTRLPMHCENLILIRAPLEKIFQTVSDLETWPKLLPHYRWVHVIERNSKSQTVQMAARRGWLPIRWTSRYEPDASVPELRFHHLKAFTRGMDVTWSFTPTTDGVLVRISHDLARSSSFGRWFAHRILRNLFIQPVAWRTLKHFKLHLESPS